MLYSVTWIYNFAMCVLMEGTCWGK